MCSNVFGNISFCYRNSKKDLKTLAQSSSVSNEEKRGFEQFIGVDNMSSEYSVPEDNIHGEKESSGDEDTHKKESPA